MMMSGGTFDYKERQLLELKTMLEEEINDEETKQWILDTYNESVLVGTELFIRKAISLLEETFVYMSHLDYFLAADISFKEMFERICNDISKIYQEEG